MLWLGPARQLAAAVTLCVSPAGVDLEQARREEEQHMLQDARQWLNSGRIKDPRQARSGATALHVAAAKGYSEVLRCVLPLAAVGGGDTGTQALEAGANAVSATEFPCVVLRRHSPFSHL